MTTAFKAFALVIFLYVLPLVASSQHFKHKADLDRIDSTGFYSIVLSPALSAFIKTDLSDIRVADAEQHWVPHVLEQQKSFLKIDSFIEFPLVLNTVSDSGKNFLIIENAYHNTINSLYVFLKNTSVNRIATLSGSNNQKDWFIIDDKVLFSSSNESSKDQYRQTIYFPAVNYQYLKLVIDNAHNDPLSITMAGSSKKSAVVLPNHYLQNPLPAFTQTDTNGLSYIRVVQQRPFQFNQVIVDVNSPRFYNRNIDICLPNPTDDRRPGLVVGNFKISSSTTDTFNIATMKTAVFFMVVTNQDNPPLSIRQISTQQQAVTFVTYLEKGKQYSLLFDDSFATSPNYDLQAFSDSIQILQQLHYSDIRPVINNLPLVVTKDNKHNWLWPIIALAGLLLAFFTYKLMADINKTKA